MEKVKILWIDDEIKLLKPHILFLERKGYKIFTINNGNDAIDFIKKIKIDIIFLDENMPGLSGLDTLSIISQIISTPVIMITKSEEEHIMEEAIGSKISDYLIKPLNPYQILLSLKKNLEIKRLVNNKVISDYQKEFQKISLLISSANLFSDWVEVYKKITFWELELDKISSDDMNEIIEMQKNEANNLFFKFIRSNYQKLLHEKFIKDDICFSQNLLKEKVFPFLSETSNNFCILIDNLRFDQWKVLQPYFEEFFNIENESIFSSILPTATQYSRNSIFSGLLPVELKKVFANYWKGENESGGKNLFEEEFLKNLILKSDIKNKKFNYFKILNSNEGWKLNEKFNSIKNIDINFIVYNFVDMLSHAKTGINMIKELTPNDKSYRHLTKTWFQNSSLYKMLSLISESKSKLFLFTDHGTINVKYPSKLIGDKNISTNLRYKTGRKLKYNYKDVMEIDNPNHIGLNLESLSSNFIFAKPNIYFTYPNNYNKFVNYFKDTYQHGGISMEEMLCPIIRLSPK
tara:strand:+ start:5396 stop:6952 length:1557 start_codon:yes stop_codon:yes gene_type:complete